MIVKNEAANIARCIESYKEIVSEIIVVDTGSTDDTVAIAKSLGAKAFYYQWNNHFANAKNFAIDQAHGDWIIFLDADEYFADNMARHIPWFIQRAVKDGDEAIACKLVNLDAENGGVLNDMFQVRIFRRHKSIRYQNSIHEALTKKNGGKIATLTADPAQLAVYHTGYSDSLSRTKMARNLPLLLAELEKAPQPRTYQYLSDSYLILDNWQEAIRYARLFIDSGANIPGYNAKPYQNIITATAQVTQNPVVIYREIAAALARFPHHPIFRFYLGRFLHRAKRYEAAYTDYQTAATLQTNYRDIETNPMQASLADMYSSLGEIAVERQRPDDALAHYVAALQIDKYQEQGFAGLMRLVQPFPTEDIVGLLNSFHNVESEADLDFLVEQLSDFTLPEVLTYYAMLRLKKFDKEDILLLYTLLANGQYAQSFTVIKDCHSESPDGFAEVLLVAAGLLSEQTEYIDWTCEQVTAPMQRLLRALLSQEATGLSNEDIGSYFALLKRFLALGSQTYVDKLLALKNQFAQTDVLFSLGDIFQARQNYDKAYELYAEFASAAEADDGRLKQAAFNMALCHYHQKQYSLAVCQLLQAYRQGYRANDLYEYLRWSIRTEQDREMAVQALGDQWKLVRDTDLCLWESQ
jgi:glycosyltransferase involved in cell wall biosynthesis